MAGTVQTPPPAAGVEATLVASWQLLNNPPSAHASPSATEQWLHDVDQLVVAAINTPHHEGGRQEPTIAHSCSPLAVRAPPSVRVPPQTRVLPSIATTDLRDELIRRCRGEDSRITIEHHRKRHRNIEGRNLERDFESLAPAREASAACVMRPTSSPASSGGCMTLAQHLWMVIWPHKFRPHMSKKYDGTVNLTKFLQIYSTSILAAGGDEVVMANYYLVALTGTTRSWLMNLPKGSLTSWQELCRQFMANFESAYSQPGNETDLNAMQQHLGESLCSSFSDFPRFAITFLVSLMFLLWLHFTWL
jgi:hypothetical protein